MRHPTCPVGARVCRVDELLPDRGAAALVDDDQIAVFRLATGEVFAVSNRDPVSGANVIARGLIGDRAGEPMVASPIYKEPYSLRTGARLDTTDPNVEGLRTYVARVVDDWVVVDVRPL